MLKLPVCPYCHAVYRYRDVSSMSGKSRHKCYHCKREFAVTRRNGRIAVMSVVCIMLIIFNIIMLYSSKNVNFHVMIITDAICIFAAFSVFPFTVRFHSVKLTKSEKKKLKDN